MDLSYLLALTVVFSGLLILIQRMEAGRRKMAWVLFIVVGLIFRHNAFVRGDVHEETLISLILAIFLSGLFWLLIGRYNPVGSSDDSIKVYGMDD